MDSPGGDSSDTRRGPGRPPQLDQPQRVALVIEAAARVLAGRGVGRATMSAIAREAGMSKRTLYELFPSRDTLIAACVRRVRMSLVRPLDPEQRDLPLAERLRLLLMPDSALMRDHLPLEILRAVITEARSQPEVARRFVAESSEALVDIIRTELVRAADRGEIALGDPEATARLLRDMVYESPCDLLLDPDPPPGSQDRVMVRMGLAIEVFLHGVAARDAPAAQRPARPG